MKIILQCTIAIFILLLSETIFAQDSTIIQDPPPVVITQEGYSEQVHPEDIPLNQRSFRQRLKIGGGINSIQLGNPTIIGLSPMVGYQATNKMIVGAGLSYIYYKIKNPYSNLSARGDVFAYSGFVRYNLAFLQKMIGNGFFTAEVEQYQGIQVKQTYTPALLAGFGLGVASGFGITAMYDFNFNYNTSFRSSPWVIRVNGFF